MTYSEWVKDHYGHDAILAYNESGWAIHAVCDCGARWAATDRRHRDENAPPDGTETDRMTTVESDEMESGCPDNEVIE